MPIDSIGVQTVNGKNFIRHKVESGEGWYSIARKYGISYAELKMANKDASEKLKVGQVLIIPAKAKVNDPRFQKNYTEPSKQPVPGKSPASASNEKKPVYHKVGSSETLFSISKKYKVTVDEVKSWNKLSSNAIKPGQNLVVGFVADQETPKVESKAPAVQKITIKETVKDENESASAVKISPGKEETVIIKTATPEPPKTEQPKSDKKYTFANGRKEINEQGVAAWIEDEEINPNKYYALHRTASNGTIIKITNKMNNKSIFVKVVGKLQETGDNEGLIIKISKASADKLGVLDQRFSAQLVYGVSEK